MLNMVALVGRITHDLELIKTPSGKSVLNFSIAVNRRYSQEDRADFIKCVAWNNQAEFMGEYLTKGDLISIGGSIQSRSYDGDSGKRVYVQEVVVTTVSALESREYRQGRITA